MAGTLITRVLLQESIIGLKPGVF